VFAAVAQAGKALQHAVGSLRTDKEVVLAAVRQDGDALQYALSNKKPSSSPTVGKLVQDVEVVLAAVVQDGKALQHAAEWLQKYPALAVLSHLAVPVLQARLRLQLALALISTAHGPEDASGSSCAIGMLSGDIVEHVGVRIVPATVVRGLTCRHGYMSYQPVFHWSHWLAMTAVPPLGEITTGCQLAPVASRPPPTGLATAAKRRCIRLRRLSDHP
jgi:hypothetical protein